MIFDSASGEHIERHIQERSPFNCNWHGNYLISNIDEGNDWGGLPKMISMNGDEKGNGSGDDYEDGDDKDW